MIFNYLSSPICLGDINEVKYERSARSLIGYPPTPKAMAGREASRLPGTLSPCSLMDRALGCEPNDCEFKSHRGHKKTFTCRI